MAMLTPEQARQKNADNAIKYCLKHGYIYLHFGSWDVFYKTPDDVGKTHIGLGGNEIENYHSTPWMVVFKDLGIE